MMRIVVVVAVLIALARARRCPLLRAPDSAIKTGCYIIVLREDTSSERMAQILQRATSTAEGNMVYGVVETVSKAFTLKLSAYSLALLREIPEVQYIEEETMAKGTQNSVPYHLDRVDQKFLPLDGHYNPIGDGEGIDIYVLDTGVYYEHQEFGNRAKFGGYDSVDDHLGENRTGRDCNGHGTHVASNAAGEKYGTAKNATIYSIRVLRCDGFAPWSIILAGLDYVAAIIRTRQRPAVVSMSIGGNYSQSINDAVQVMHRRGIPMVVTAGNNARDACSRSPASSPDAITVAGSANGDTLFTQTNYGSCVDIFAPGHRVQGADLQCSTCSSFWTGTSFAAPLVSGAIAILLQRQPGMSPDQITEELISSSTKNILDFSLIPVTFRSCTPNQVLFIPGARENTSVQNDRNLSEFVVAFGGNHVSRTDSATLTLFISSVEPGPVPITIETLRGFKFTGFATNNDTLSVDIPNTFQVTSITERDKGIRIIAENQSQIMAYGMNYERGTSDGFLALPCYHLPQNEYEYYALSYSDRVTKGHILIVSCEDNTFFEIDSNIVQLNKLHTYLWESKCASGTRIVSNRPLAVFIGNRCTNVPIGHRFCDHLTEQVPPTALWGKRFLTASIPSRGGELYRLIAAKSSTTVTVNCSTFEEVVTYNIPLAGSWREFITHAMSYCSITSDKPLLVMQFALGKEYDGLAGDPFMMMITAIEQYSNKYVLNVPPQFPMNYLALYVTPKDFKPQHIFLNDVNLENATWTGVYCSDRVICGYITHVNVSSGVHQLYHTEISSRIGASAFGFNSSSSYGYPIGIQPDLPRTLCPTLRKPINGTVKMNLSGFTHMAVFSCDFGFGLIGTPVLFCQKHGTWSGEPPICKPVLETCPLSEPCDSCCPVITCPSLLPCPSPTCPTCPLPTPCPSNAHNRTTECLTFSSSTTCLPCPSTPTTPVPMLPLVPGNVENVRSPGCGVLEWDAPDGGVGGLSYKIRFYSGQNYLSTPLSQRIILSSPTNSLTFSEQDIPSGRPLFATVKARNRNGVHSPHWSMPITAAVDGCP